MKPFQLLLGEEASQQILWLPPEEQWHAFRAIQTIVQNPFTTGLPYWRAEDGRTHHLRSVHGWTVTFWVDDADRSIRIVAIDFE